MDYETMYQAYQALEKSLKDKLKGLTKLQKALGKELESGELKSFPKDIAATQSTTSEVSEVLKEIEHLVSGFDARAYIEQGYYATQMLDICDEQGIDVIGEFPMYEMFPFTVRFDVENQEISIDRKKIMCARPASLVSRIQNSRDKLMKASFNASQFANELANAYDLVILASNKQPESDVYLQTIYKYLVPMSRFKKDYDQQSFAFDLARLFSSDMTEVKDGRSYQFGPSRNNKKAIRILDHEGHEHFLATIRFFS